LAIASRLNTFLRRFGCETCQHSEVIAQMARASQFHRRLAAFARSEDVSNQ